MSPRSVQTSNQIDLYPIRAMRISHHSRNKHRAPAAPAFSTSFGAFCETGVLRLDLLLPRKAIAQQHPVLDRSPRSAPPGCWPECTRELPRGGVGIEGRSGLPPHSPHSFTMSSTCSASAAHTRTKRSPSTTKHSPTIPSRRVSRSAIRSKSPKRCKPSEVSRLIRWADSSGDGKIDMREFEAAIRRFRRLTNSKAVAKERRGRNLTLKLASSMETQVLYLLI